MASLKYMQPSQTACIAFLSYLLMLLFVNVITSVQSLSHVWLFATQWTAARQPPCPSPTPRLYSNSCPLSQWCYPVISSSVFPFFLLPSIFSKIRVYSNESVLCIRWPKYWCFSFNIRPSNEYSGLMSFRIYRLDLRAAKDLSRVFSNITVHKYQFFSSQLSL